MKEDLNSLGEIPDMSVPNYKRKAKRLLIFLESSCSVHDDSKIFLMDDDKPEKIEWLKNCKENNINPDTGKRWRSENSKNYKGGKGPNFKDLKNRKVSLSYNEKELVMKQKSVWHHSSNNEETPAVFKSIMPSGKTWYTTNTHRAYNTTQSLQLTIDRYHDFIKGTA